MAARASLVGSLAHYEEYYRERRRRLGAAELAQGQAPGRQPGDGPGPGPARIQALAVAPENREKIVASMRKVRLMGLEKLKSENRLSSEVKLGPGGIRTIEFYVQYLQILHGRDLPELITGNTLAALGKLWRYRLVSRQLSTRCCPRATFSCGASSMPCNSRACSSAMPCRTRPEELEKLARRMGFEERLGQSAAAQFRERYRQHMLTLQELSSDPVRLRNQPARRAPASTGNGPEPKGKGHRRDRRRSHGGTRPRRSGQSRTAGRRRPRGHRAGRPGRKPRERPATGRPRPGQQPVEAEARAEPGAASFAATGPHRAKAIRQEGLARQRRPAVPGRPSGRLPSPSSGRLMATLRGQAAQPTLDLAVGYHQFLRENNKDLDLTRLIGFETMAQRHYADCMILHGFMQGKWPSPLVDVGSGAGFPGIMIKLMSPKTRIVLAEPRPRRVDFLERAIKELKLKDISVFPHKVTSRSLTEPMAGDHHPGLRDRGEDPAPLRRLPGRGRQGHLHEGPQGGRGADRSPERRVPGDAEPRLPHPQHHLGPGPAGDGAHQGARRSRPGSEACRRGRGHEESECRRRTRTD